MAKANWTGWLGDRLLTEHNPNSRIVIGLNAHRGFQLVHPRPRTALTRHSKGEGGSMFRWRVTTSDAETLAGGSRVRSTPATPIHSLLP
jgi:hypothetical protein